MYVVSPFHRTVLLERSRITGSFIFGVALFYGISDLDAILDSSVQFPLTEAYIQATSSKGATFGLLLIIVLAGLFALQALCVMVSEEVRTEHHPH